MGGENGAEEPARPELEPLDELHWAVGTIDPGCWALTMDVAVLCNAGRDSGKGGEGAPTWEVDECVTGTTLVPGTG